MPLRASPNSAPSEALTNLLSAAQYGEFLFPLPRVSSPHFPSVVRPVCELDIGAVVNLLHDNKKLTVQKYRELLYEKMNTR